VAERASSSARVTDDASVSDDLFVARIPATTEPSTTSIVGDLVARHGGSAMNALQHADEATLERFGASLRAASRAQGVSYTLLGEGMGGAREGVALNADQQAALRAFDERSQGAMIVQWDETRGGASSFDRLWFVHRNPSARAVATRFVDVMFPQFAALWRVGSREELVVSEERPLDDGMTVVRFRREVGGIAVRGEWFEAHITTSQSRLGEGVLTHFGANLFALAAIPPATPRTEWLTAELAASVLHRRSRVVGSELLYARGHELRPLWTVQTEDGWATTVDAITGDVLNEADTHARFGPIQLQGWVPGGTGMQPILFRGVNITDNAGVSVGNSSWKQATHTITGTNRIVELQGAVGMSNPNAQGRVYRIDAMSNILTLTAPWNATAQPARNFGLPDAWPSNSGSIPFPHTTEIVYGWLSYGQNLLRNLGMETVDRLAMKIDLLQDANGISGNATGTWNIGQPDQFGSQTNSVIDVSTGPSDDLDATRMMPTGDGDDVFSVFHEFGHTINSCASAPGDNNCADRYPASLIAMERQMYTNANWKPAVWDAFSETNSSYIAHVLTQFRYGNDSFGRFDSSWRFVSYDNITDNFGSPTQSGFPNDCVAMGCSPGFRCVQRPMHREWGIMAPTAGYCEQICGTWTGGSPAVNITNPCQSAMFCTDPASTTVGSVVSCWHDQYRNRFFDSVGDRLTTMVGWRQGLLTQLAAVSGQSANPKRDILGDADS
jgi:hypothetical protein